MMILLNKIINIGYYKKDYLNNIMDNQNILMYILNLVLFIRINLMN